MFPVFAVAIFGTIVLLCVSEYIPEVYWSAPFFSGGGYSSEAITFAIAITQTVEPQIYFSIIYYGDTFDEKFVRGLTPQESQLLFSLIKKSNPVSRKTVRISLCHSEPGAWYAPHPRYHTSRCPVPNSDFIIGRTMLETNSIPEVGSFKSCDSG